MPRILCGGFSDPFDPFDGLNIDPEAPGLQLHVDKLAPGQENQWVAGAVWGQSDDAPEELPAIAGGAITWTDNTQTHHTHQWDESPLQEDPRGGNEKQPFGYFKPKWVGEGCFIGHEFFALEPDVELGNPILNATTIIDLPPGRLIVPEAIAGLSRYDFTNGRPVFITPQAPSAAGTTTINEDGLVYQGACDEDWVAYNTGLSELDYDLPQAYGHRYGQGQIVFEKFHLNQTVAQVQGNPSRPQADPLTRAPQVGDKLAINVNHGYFYQPAIGPYFTFSFESVVEVPGWPAGTWEFWIYTVPTTGERTVQSITENPTQNYGVAIAGTEHQDIARTGEIAQLLWSYGQPTLLKGTWSLTRTTTRTGQLSRPPNTTGPAQGDTDSPNGTGYPTTPTSPGGWPSARDAASADAGFFRTVPANLTAAGYYRPVVLDHLITWDWLPGIPPVVAPYYTSEWVPNDNYPSQVTYDTRKGSAPRFIVKESQPYQGKVGLVDSNSSGAPYARLGYEGRSGAGIHSFTLVGPSPPCWIEAPDPLGPPGPNGGSYCQWVKGPKSGDCDVYVQWCQRPLIYNTYVTRWLEPEPGRAPVEPIPNPDDFSDEPGSALPDLGGGAPEVPPEFGFPPGMFPEADWEEAVAEETEYDIDAAVGPTLRSRRYFKSTFTESSNHSADWNGARSNSSLTATPTTGTYTLEYIIPVPMVSRSPRNSADGTPEEALFLVRTLESRTQPSPFTTPYPYDTQVVYYQRAGSQPVAIDEGILELFPAIAWQDPEQYQWSRQCQIRDGVLYIVPGPTGSADYRNKNTKVTLTTYRINDGSLSPINEVTRKIKSLNAPSAVVYDGAGLF